MTIQPITEADEYGSPEVVITPEMQAEVDALRAQRVPSRVTPQGFRALVRERELHRNEARSIETIGQVPDRLRLKLDPLTGTSSITSAQQEQLQAIYDATHDEDPAYHWVAFKQQAKPYLEATHDPEAAMKEWREQQGLPEKSVVAPGVRVQHQGVNQAVRLALRSYGTISEWPTPRNTGAPAQDAFYKAWHDAHTSRGLTTTHMTNARNVALEKDYLLANTMERLRETSVGNFSRDTFVNIMKHADRYFDALEEETGQTLGNATREELQELLDAAVKERRAGYADRPPTRLRARD